MNLNFNELEIVLNNTLKGKEFSYQSKYGGEVRDIVSEVYIVTSISWGDEEPTKPVDTVKGRINVPIDVRTSWYKPKINVRGEIGNSYEFEMCRFR